MGASRYLPGVYVFCIDYFPKGHHDLTGIEIYTSKLKKKSIPFLLLKHQMLQFNGSMYFISITLLRLKHQMLQFNGSYNLLLYS